jgi:hypothetical protein
MAQILSLGSNSGTPQNKFYDASRSAPMLDGEKIFSKLGLNNNADVNNLVNKMSSLKNLLTSTKYHELENVWPEVEKILNQGSNISVESETGIGQFVTAISFFYESFNAIDKNPQYNALAGMRVIFLELYDKSAGSILNHQTGKDKRLLETTLSTINSRMNRIVKTFNTKVDQGKISAPKIGVS